MGSIIIDPLEELRRILIKYNVNDVEEILDLIVENKVPPNIAFQEYLEAYELKKLISNSYLYLEKD